MSQNPQEQQQEQVQEQQNQVEEDNTMEEEVVEDELLQFEKSTKNFVKLLISTNTLQDIITAMHSLERINADLKIELTKILRNRSLEQQEKQNKVKLIADKFKITAIQIRRVSILYNDLINRQNLPCIEFNLPTEIDIFVHALEGTRFEPVGMSTKIDVDGCYILALKWKLLSK